MGVISRHVLGDLTADQLDGAVIRLGTSHIADDAEQTLPYRTAHVQLAVGFEGKIDGWILNVPPHVTDIIRHRQNVSRGTVAVQSNGNGIVFFSQHTPHDGGNRQKSAQSCGCRGSGLVQTDRLVDDLLGIDHVDPRTAVRSHGAKNGR